MLFIQIIKRIHNEVIKVVDIYIHKHKHVHVRIHIHMGYTYMYIYTCTYTYTCTYICTYTCVYLCLYISTWAIRTCKCIRTCYSYMVIKQINKHVHIGYMYIYSYTWLSDWMRPFLGNMIENSSYCIWSVISSFPNRNRWSSSVGLFYHARSVEKRPKRLRLEIGIKWHSKCNRL